MPFFVCKEEEELKVGMLFSVVEHSDNSASHFCFQVANRPGTRLSRLCLLVKILETPRRPSKVFCKVLHSYEPRSFLVYARTCKGHPPQILTELRAHLSTLGQYIWFCEKG